MKKCFVFALTAGLLLSIATVSMAEAIFSGEITAGFQGWQQTVSGSTTQTVGQSLGSFSSHSSDYLFGKMALTGKLGSDLSGTLVFKDTDNTYTPAIIGNTSSFALDEASMTLAGDWGTLKFGYFGWNNNLKDILTVWSDDFKSQATLALSTKLTDHLMLGLAYAFTGTQSGEVHDAWINNGSFYARGDTDYDTYTLGGNLSNLDAALSYKNAFGADLGVIRGIFGGDLVYYHYNEQDSAWGINAYLKLGDFKPFVEYRNFQSNGSAASTYNLVNSIIGLSYDSAQFPLYARLEVDLNGNGFFASSFNTTLPGGQIDTCYYFNPHYAYEGSPWGARIGYKFASGAKIEAQYFHTGFNSVEYDSAHFNFSSYSVPENEYYLKFIFPF